MEQGVQNGLGQGGPAWEGTEGYLSTPLAWGCPAPELDRSVSSA